MKFVPKSKNNEGELFFLYQLVDEGYLKDAICYTSKIAAGREYTLIISSNTKFERVSGVQYYLVFSDNTYREFSGWNLCIDAVQQKITKNSVLVFLNQTCSLYRENFLRDKLRKHAIDKAISISYPAVFGEAHYSQYEGSLPRAIPRRYLNTAFFIVAKPHVSLENIFLSEVSCNNNIYEFEFFKDQDCHDYVEYVNSVVSGKHPKIKWHNYKKYIGNEFEQSKKAMTVFLEHRITKKLLELGFEVENIVPNNICLVIYIKIIDKIKIFLKMRFSA